MNLTELTAFGQRLLRSGLGAPILLMMMLGMMVIPLPPFLLDIFFTFNISLALVILLAAVYVKRPLDFEVFPTVILIATLLRLALNIASTRIVLLEGHTGTDAAGQVIKAFGEFVVGGNTAVGLVIFLILVIINFVVVTKGATRVAEVSARFTLDSMPGKQMAIDADLNAGLINQEEAKARREEVSRESDFYGSMDGAGKFVRGDAIAGILILVITIIGGLSVGMLQHDMGLADATHNYTLLTIGDGLVAQIPALLLSTAAGLMVTRASVSTDMGVQVLSQLFSSPRALTITAVILGVMGLIPGMPNLVFLLFSAMAGGAAWWVTERNKRIAAEPVAAPVTEEPSNESRELSWDDVEVVDIIGLEVGYRLIPMVDKNQGGQLMGRIKGVRKKLSQELGFLIPSVHIRDNLDLAPNAYRLSLMGVPVGEAEIQPEHDMAINPGQVFGSIPGTATTDPAFGLEAVWIEASQRDQAQSLGYTVVDASTVVATHLSHILQSHADELLGHEEVQQLLDKLSKSTPKLVEDLVPKQLSLATVLKVLQSLLQEHISIRDMRTIAETLAEHAPISQDAGVLTAAVRVALGRSIVQQISGMEAELSVLTLEPSLEQILHQTLQGGAEGAGGLEPGLAENLHKSLIEETQRQEAAGRPAVLLVSQAVRTLLARFVRHSIPGLHVLAFNEIPDNKQVKIMATVGG
ncbi:MAG: flagellar biosynthesis protein FlhA [Gammaproteobacteria bacterium]|nr:flagellar biosynthesis protein FlhA [Gammaproteobacteria bacterium]